jgi:class 3 adenylate cyclase
VIDVRPSAGEAVAEEIEGERKTVTALFADLKGSTELLETLDPEEGRAIVEPLLRIMSDAVRRYEGYLVRTTGDGVFALFGAPIAYEDHPQRALYAALQMQQEIRAYAKDRTAKALPALEARVGVHTGEVVAYSGEASGKVEYRLIGHTANLAARMESIAAVGSIAISDTTAKLCAGYFELRELGPTIVKGVSTPVNVYEVLGPGPLRTHFELSTRRGLTRFVGRERELEQMRRALEQSMAGHGQIVAVVADAGTGKSRLFYEFKAQLPSGCKLLEAYSVSYGKASAWLPVLEFLRDYFGIGTADDVATRREKVWTALAALDPGLNDALPYLWGLLGIQETPDPLAQMDPQIRLRRTRDAFKRIIISESLVQPTVVIFEDLHWIDGETQALLDLVADSIGNARVLLLVNYRPEYEYRHQWGNKSYYSQLRLDTLGRESATEILAALLGESGELDALKHIIIERTQGNPFFIEEMVQALFDEGALVRNGTVKMKRPLGQLRMPPTVQGILAARIDGLQTAEKDLLQTLAVVGRQAPLAVIMEIVARPQIERVLGNLQAREFIYEQVVSGTAVAYEFKHALTQDVAYNTLLIERRKALHERTAQALEALFVDSVDEHLADLSYHYSRSGNDSRAIDYLIRAGEQAHQRSAFSQAATYLEQALTRLNDQPAGIERDRKEIAIRTGLGNAAIVVKGYAAPEYEHHLNRQHELAQQLGDTTQSFYSLAYMSVLVAFRLELSRARDIGWKLLQIADHERDPLMQLHAHGSLAHALWLSGDYTRSLEHSEKGLALFAHEKHLAYGPEHWRAACQFYAGCSTAALGFPDKGLRRALEFLASAREGAQLLPLAFALNEVATILVWRGEAALALKHAEALLALASEHGFTNWLSIGQIIHGQALTLLGRAEEAITEIKAALADYAMSGAVVPGWEYAALASACLAAPQPAEGLRVAAEALEVTAKTGDAAAQSELHQLYGELVLMSDPMKAAIAESYFRTAIEVSRKQCAKWPELRATLSLARLLAHRGRRHEARSTLAEIYNWFTEGFDTADLKDAKALLDELSNSA